MFSHIVPTISPSLSLTSLSSVGARRDNKAAAAQQSGRLKCLHNIDDSSSREFAAMLYSCVSFL